MDVVGSLVGIHDLEIHHVAHDAKLVGDSVAAEHVARQPGDFERLVC